MRVFIKGGTWRNSEDEVLKAAIMKYGKNNWDRVASLLNRKSAKACKARWYEWLDPSIKKTEWTREEEEKLLHLAKIMPTQWRTIAPIIGRTPAQCLEHYERLLDQAQAREGTAVVDSENDPRRLRPGEIDPNPETRPAIPDRVDMDEDEKEMLSEARARLANTQGKKAKRKARERQLEEARRLAALQKRRELKAAGIVVGSGLHGMSRKKKQHFVDYNKENPLYKAAPVGFFDTGEEKERTRRMAETASSKFINLSLEQLRGKRKELEEKKLRKLDRKKAKERAKRDLPSLVKTISDANDPGYISQRADIQLPAPQVSDRELEEIGKMGYTVEDVEDTSGASAATRQLLSDYKAAPVHMGTPYSATGMRTPLRTPARPDTILESARDLAALSKQQTPLVGGSNVELQSQQVKDFGGVTPRVKSAGATPNPLATPGATPLIGRGAATPAISTVSMGGAGATPVRDLLQINEDIADSGGLDFKSSLRQSLMSLPAPSSDKYQFKVAMPKSEAGSGVDETVVEDAGELKKRKQAARRAKMEERLRRRSQAVQRNLPRPQSFNGDIFESDGQDGDKGAGDSDPETLIKREFVTLLRHDIEHHSSVQSGRKRKRKRLVSTLEDDFTSEELEKARDMILEEFKQSGDESKADVDEFVRAWEDVMHNAVVDTILGEVILNPTKTQRIQYERAQFEQLAKMYRLHEQRASELEDKLNHHLTDYVRRVKALEKEIGNLVSMAQEETRSHAAFEALHDLESMAAPKRLATLAEEVHVMRQRESELQKEFRELQDESAALHQSLRHPL